jgi:excisionase family DNA binding protein
MNLDGFLTTEAVSERLELSETLVRRYCREGRFPGAFQVRREWLVPIAAVEAFVKRPRGKPRKEPEEGRKGGWVPAYV